MSRTAEDGTVPSRPPAGNGNQAISRAARLQERKLARLEATTKAAGSPASNQGEQLTADGSSGSAATEEPQDNLESTFGSNSENNCFSFGATAALKQQLEASRGAAGAREATREAVGGVPRVEIAEPPDAPKTPQGADAATSPRQSPAKSPGGTHIPPPSSATGSPRSDGGDFTFGTSVPLKLPDLSQVPKSSTGQDTESVPVPATGSSTPPGPWQPRSATGLGEPPSERPPMSASASLEFVSGSQASASLAPVMEYSGPPSVPPTLPQHPNTLPTSSPGCPPGQTAGPFLPQGAAPQGLPEGACWGPLGMQGLGAVPVPPFQVPGASGQPQEAYSAEVMRMMGQYPYGGAADVVVDPYGPTAEAAFCGATPMVAGSYGPYFDAPPAPTMYADGRWIASGERPKSQLFGLPLRTLAAVGCIATLLVGAAMLTAVFLLRDQ